MAQIILILRRNLIIDNTGYIGSYWPYLFTLDHDIKDWLIENIGPAPYDQYEDKYDPYLWYSWYWYWNDPGQRSVTIISEHADKLLLLKLSYGNFNA